jgi:hypothetical protein
MSATPDVACESWRLVWRTGLAPVLPTAGLEALAAALKADDHRLTQGSTTTPPPLMCVQDWPVECACAVALAAGVATLGGFADERATGRTTNAHAATVGAVEEAFAKAMYDADCALGEPGTVRFFLNWFDDTPRDEMRAELLPEVERELQRRPP